VIGLFWYTLSAVLAFGIIQTRCRELSLVHGQDAARDNALPKTVTASSLLGPKAKASIICLKIALKF